MLDQRHSAFENNTVAFKSDVRKFWRTRRSWTLGSSCLFRSQNTLGGNPSGLRSCFRLLIIHSTPLLQARWQVGMRTAGWFRGHAAFPKHRPNPRNAPTRHRRMTRVTVERKSRSQARIWPTVSPLLQGSFLLVTVVSEKVELQRLDSEITWPHLNNCSQILLYITVLVLSNSPLGCFITQIGGNNTSYYWNFWLTY